MQARMDAARRDAEHEEIALYVAHRKGRIKLDYVKKIIIENLKRGLILDSAGVVRKIKPNERAYIAQLLLDGRQFDKYAAKLLQAQSSFFQKNKELRLLLSEYDKPTVQANIAIAVHYHMKHNKSKVNQSTLDGVDFTKPVKIKKLSGHEVIYSAQKKGYAVGEIRQGEFYSPTPAITDDSALPVRSADERGISAFADDADTEYSADYGSQVADKTDTAFYGNKAEVLETTSSEIWDTWSSTIPILTQGGGTQYQIMGEEKSKVKSLDMFKIERILKRIDQGQQKALSVEEIEGIYKYLYVFKSRRDFAASKGMKSAVAEAQQRIYEVGRMLKKISQQDHNMENLRDYQQEVASMDGIRESISRKL